MLRKPLVAVAALALQACVTFPPPSRSQEACDPTAPGEFNPDTVRRQRNATLTKVIRLTDHGELVSRCEWTDALMELRAFPDASQIVVVYVHGWKHNARPTDTDLLRFNDLLESIRVRESRLPTPRRIVGIYVGWNGKQTGVPVLKEVTFWSRKAAADRISQSAIVTKLLGTIDNIRDQREERRRTLDDIVIYVGHSFGARILFTAASQLLIHRVQMAHPGRDGGSYEPIRGAGDLVLLINPAFEASLFTTLHSVRRSREMFHPDQQPLLVSISADNDNATKIAFPLAIPEDYGEKGRRTLGNFAPYRTHRVQSNRPGQSAPRSSEAAWFDHFCNQSVCLTRTEGYGQRANPFVVASAEPSIVDGHNGIWHPVFTEFLADFVAAVLVRHASVHD
jgi:hypothetical protein